MNVIGQFKLTTPMQGTNVNKLKVDQADQPVSSQVYRLQQLSKSLACQVAAVLEEKLWTNN